MERLGKDWIDISEYIKKKTIRTGGGANPESFHICDISYSIKLSDDTELENKQRVKYELGNNFKSFDEALQTMKPRERSKFYIKSNPANGIDDNNRIGIPIDADFFIDIELFNYTARPKKKEEMNLSEKLQIAKIHKDNGIKYFKDNKYNEAALEFQAGLEMLYGEGLSTDARELMISLGLNICNCLNLLGEYARTIDRLGFVMRMKKDHPKAFYYSGIANVNLGNIDKAEEDYSRLSELVPSNDAGVGYLRKLIDEKAPKSDKKIFKSLLKANLYDGIEKEQEMRRRKRSSDDEAES